MKPEARRNIQKLDAWDCFTVLWFALKRIYAREYKPAPFTFFIMHVCVGIVVVAATIPQNMLYIPIVLGVSLSFGIIIETFKRIQL